MLTITYKAVEDCQVLDSTRRSTSETLLLCWAIIPLSFKVWPKPFELDSLDGDTRPDSASRNFSTWMLAA